VTLTEFEGSNSEINIKPVAIFDDPFRGFPHVLVMSEAFNAGDSAKPKTGKDGGAGVLGKLKDYKACVLAEYVWLDAHQTPRSKTKTLTARPTKVSDLPVWNYDGSSTEQAEGSNSEINIKPVAISFPIFR